MSRVSTGKSTFAYKVRHLRKENGFTQTQLARLLGLHLQTVQSWEYQQRVPRKKRQSLVLAMLKRKKQQAEKSPIRKLLKEYYFN